MMNVFVRPGGDAGRVRNAAGAAWPGSMVERALEFFAADFRRPAGPVVVALFLSVLSVALTVRRPVAVSLEVALPLAVAATAPLALVRRFPAVSLSLVLAANGVYLLFWRDTWPAGAICAWLLALGACPNLLPRRGAVAAVAAAELVVLCAAFVPVAVNATQWDATLVDVLAVVAAWGAGEMLRARRQGAVERAAAAAQMRALSERSAVARERSSIARELHDVVAHHVSMIAVRAATAPYAIPELSAPGQEAFREITAEARAALSELRVILGVLRGPEGHTEAAPQPRIKDLDGLLSRITGTGADVTMSVHGEPRPLAESVELCVYRLVQETMTNMRRHAPGARAEVELAYRPDEIYVRVHDNGPARSGRGATGPAGGSGRAATPRGSARAAAGFGLAGMRERVAMLNGSFEAGPDGQGGFLVSASLPVCAGSAGRGLCRPVDPDQEPGGSGPAVHQPGCSRPAGGSGDLAGADARGATG